ncbi:MAG: hypothetical protein N2316_01175 [Spirochaetes bacterium]|nr:hypothetical protein [Spirochaetota bacterium]
MNTLFDLFIEFHEDFANKYDKQVLSTIFSSLTSTLESTNEEAIPIDLLINNAKEDLSKKKLSVLDLEFIVKKMMSFLTLFYELEEDSFENHREIGEKILWKILARYIKDPENYISPLYTDIITHFEKSKAISINEISLKLCRKKKYRVLSEEAISYCVEGLFDFFVAKGNIARN